MTDRIVFIIPGHLDSPHKREYQLIGKAFKNQGINPVFVPVKWKRTTISQCGAEFKKLFENTKAKEKYILGFSWGAMIAYLIASDVQVNTLVLCSLSPWFAEDLPKLPKSWVNFAGKNRLNDFKNMPASAIAAKITANTFLLYGLQEHSLVEVRAKGTFGSLKCKKQIVAIEGVKHDIADEKYLDKIYSVISCL